VTAVLTLFANDKIYTEGVVPNFGGFMTFPEFLNNMPSELDSSFVLEVNESSYDPTDPTYVLMYNRNGRSRTFNENLFAFSDGEKVYIRVNSSSLFSENYRTLTIGQFYSYFSDSYTVSPMATGGNMSDPGMINTVLYIIDMESGRQIPLTRPVLRQLLREKDLELYQYLLAHEDDDKTLLQYIDSLNQRLSEK